MSVHSVMKLGFHGRGKVCRVQVCKAQVASVHGRCFMAQGWQCEGKQIHRHHFLGDRIHGRVGNLTQEQSVLPAG